MLVFVPPDQVPVDPSLDNLGQEHLQLARALFRPKKAAAAPPPPPALEAGPSPPPLRALTTRQQPLLLSLGLVNRWVLVGTVCAVGLACIVYAGRPFLGGRTGHPLHIGTLYVLLVLVAFALA